MPEPVVALAPATTNVGARAINGKVYAVGGYKDGALPTTEVYTP